MNHHFPFFTILLSNTRLDRKYWILYIVLNRVRSTKRDPKNSNETRVPSRWLTFYRMAVHGTMTIESFIFTRYPSTRATNVKGMNVNVIEFPCIIPSNLPCFSYYSKDNSRVTKINYSMQMVYSANGKLRNICIYILIFKISNYFYFWIEIIRKRYYKRWWKIIFDWNKCNC